MRERSCRHRIHDDDRQLPSSSANHSDRGGIPFGTWHHRYIDWLPIGGWFAEQKITVHEALEAYTINNAAAAFEDHIRGSLTPGKLADIAVCDRNLLEIPTNEILQMEILLTVVNGKIVYESASKD